MRRSILALLTPVILLTVNAPGVSAAPPNNDDVGDARTVAALPYRDTVDTSEATNPGTDPVCSGGDVQSVWYRFRASASGPVRVAVGADFDATVDVYTGPPDDLRPVACADDPPSLTLNARSGTTYHIMVASCCGQEGGMATLTVESLRRPTLGVRLRGGTADTRTGDATVRAVVSCGNARTASIFVEVRQRTRAGRIAVGRVWANVACNSTGRRSRTLVLSDWAFRPGWARVRLSARTCRRGVCVSRGVNRIIRLERRPLT